MVRSQDFELTIFARGAVSMMKNCSKKQKTHCEVLSCYYRDDKLTTEEVFQEKIFRPEHTLFIRHRFPSAVFFCVVAIFCLTCTRWDQARCGTSTSECPSYTFPFLSIPLSIWLKRVFCQKGVTFVRGTN